MRTQFRKGSVWEATLGAVWAWGCLAMQVATGRTYQDDKRHSPLMPTVGSYTTFTPDWSKYSYE